jgi:MauM/NapG family ferredoxin protein
MGIMARFVSLNLIPAVISVAKPLYGSLEPALLRMRPHFFAHSLTIFLLFAFVCGLALVRKRLWCRSICPLGALYAIPGRFAALRRVVDVCSGCKKCESVCRMGAINDDASYIAGECILCMDCLYGCPEHAARFTWHVPWDRPAAAVKHSEKTPLAKNEPRLTRGKFLFLALSSLGLSGFSFREKDPSSRTAVIRPPAALIEEEFVDRCVRCGNCMKVCVTNGLQPTLFQAGLGGIWTPRLVPEIGHCEYQCALCGETCPTGAIPAISVERKRSLRLGLAEIDHSICLPWAEGRDCVVCEEYCPLPGKAIRLVKERRAAAVLSKPYIDERLCIGCGICQNKCPTRPIRAVRVSPRQSDRTRGGKDHGRFS